MMFVEDWTDRNSNATCGRGAELPIIDIAQNRHNFRIAIRDQFCFKKPFLEVEKVSNFLLTLHFYIFSFYFDFKLWSLSSIAQIGGGVSISVMAEHIHTLNDCESRNLRAIKWKWNSDESKTLNFSKTLKTEVAAEACGELKLML